MDFNLADLFEGIVDVIPERTAVVGGARRASHFKSSTGVQINSHIIC